MWLEDVTVSTSLEAVYENGVFRPLQPIELPEHVHVTVTFDEDATGATGAIDRAHFTLPAQDWDAFWAALDAPPRDIPALRKLLTEPSLFDGK